MSLSGKEFIVDDTSIAHLDRNLFADYREEIFQHTGIHIDVLDRIREEITDEERATMMHLLQHEQYTDFRTYIERWIPDIKQLYVLETKKKSPRYDLNLLVREDLLVMLNVLNKQEIELFFQYIQPPLSIPLPEITSLDEFKNYLYMRGFAAGAREKLISLAQQHSDDDQWDVHVVIEENTLKIRVHNVYIYKHILNSPSQKAFAYKFLQSCAQNQDELYHITHIPKKIYEAAVADLHEDMVYNVSKEKTYIPDMNHFVLLCQQLGLFQSEIDLFCSDIDIQQYINSKEAYVSVRYFPETPYVCCTLFDKAKDELLAVVKQTSNLQEIEKILQLFRQENQDLFSSVKEKSFTLDASF